MSMITEQVEQLRELAEELHTGAVGLEEAESIISEAADTIEAYQKAFEDIEVEIGEARKNALRIPNWEYVKGLGKALSIIDKHNPDKVGKESE